WSTGDAHFAPARTFGAQLIRPKNPCEIRWLSLELRACRKISSSVAQSRSKAKLSGLSRTSGSGQALLGDIPAGRPTSTSHFQSKTQRFLAVSNGKSVVLSSSANLFDRMLLHGRQSCP